MSLSIGLLILTSFLLFFDRHYHVKNQTLTTKFTRKSVCPKDFRHKANLLNENFLLWLHSA